MGLLWSLCSNGLDDDGNGLTDCDDPAMLSRGSVRSQALRIVRMVSTMMVTETQTVSTRIVT